MRAHWRQAVSARPEPVSARPEPVSAALRALKAAEKLKVVIAWIPLGVLRNLCDKKQTRSHMSQWTPEAVY